MLQIFSQHARVSYYTIPGGILVAKYLLYIPIVMKYLLLLVPVALVFVLATILFALTNIGRIIVISIAGFLMLFFGNSLARATKTTVFSR